jgi:uncharacterized surface protein with fasciclin (FAS1) repeats
MHTRMSCTMFRRLITMCAALSVLTAAGIGDAAGIAAKEKTVMVGGTAMYPSKDINDNAMNSKDHTTLVAAVKAAGLVNTLKGPGSFTVFAPTNAAFDKLPKGTFEMKDAKLWLNDGKGMTASITIPDVYQSNGVIHVLDTVVMAK